MHSFNEIAERAKGDNIPLMFDVPLDAKNWIDVWVDRTNAMLGGCNEMARRADEAFPAKNGHPAMLDE